MAVVETDDIRAKFPEWKDKTDDEILNLIRDNNEFGEDGQTVDLSDVISESEHTMHETSEHMSNEVVIFMDPEDDMFDQDLKVWQTSGQIKGTTQEWLESLPTYQFTD